MWAEVRISVLIICKFSNKWTCTRKKEVEGLSCGFEDNLIGKPSKGKKWYITEKGEFELGV